jgi:hypothetical protein
VRWRGTTGNRITRIDLLRRSGTIALEDRQTIQRKELGLQSISRISLDRREIAFNKVFVGPVPRPEKLVENSRAVFPAVHGAGSVKESAQSSDHREGHLRRESRLPVDRRVVCLRRGFILKSNAETKPSGSVKNRNDHRPK